MKLPKELYDLGKMKLTYRILQTIAGLFMVVAVTFLALAIYFTKSSISEVLICVAISIIIGFKASDVQRSYFIFQKLQEIQDQINKAKES